MHDSVAEKDRKISLLEFANKGVHVPRTFVFDQHIPENEYHLYIDPEEYYNEELDACRDEFQNYRTTSLQKKQMKTTTKAFRMRKPKNIRLCMTSQNAMRAATDGLKESRKASQNLDLKSLGAEDENEKKLGSKSIKDGTNEDASVLLLFGEKDKKGMAVPCKWNRKEIELSTELRDNDQTQILIEKTKRALRKNEQECAKLKRRVNDENFANGYKQNKTSIRKTNIALEAVFNENELEVLLNNDEIQAEKEKATTFQGGYISRYVDNDVLNVQKKGPNRGYGSKIVEKANQQVFEKPKKKKKNINKVNINRLIKTQMSEVKKEADVMALTQLQEARLKGVFPEQVNQFRVKAMKYVKIQKTEKSLENQLNFAEIIRKFRAKSPTMGPRNPKPAAMEPRISLKGLKKDSQSNSHGTTFLTEDERKLLNYIKDVLTKPMNEGTNVQPEEKIELHEARLQALRKSQVSTERLNFFSLDKRVQNIKFENLHLI